MRINEKHTIKEKQTTVLLFIPTCSESMIRLFMTVIMALILCWMWRLPILAVSADDWYAVSGTFNQTDGSQYNNGKLQLLPLDNGCVLFELDVMQGSEAEDISKDFRLPGTFFVEEDGTGTWQEETENGKVSLQFVLDSETVTVIQTGILPIPVEGTYIWLEESLEVTPESAGALLEGLATATTSLNHNNGEYRLEMSDIEVDGWFYDIKATFVDTGALIGEFLIANDLSAVYRIDTEYPILIYGSADSMMAAVRSVEAEEVGEATAVSSSETSQEEPEILDDSLYTIPLVDAMPSLSTLPVGKTANVLSVTPGNIPSVITCVSENSEIATVDTDGVITGVSPGKAVIAGKLNVDGSEKDFRFEITVFATSIQALDIKTNIKIGETFTMSAKPVGVTDMISWSVSDTEMAEIDAITGKLIGKKG